MYLWSRHFKVSLLDAEGEGEVGRYFQHAVILRSTIISLRNVLKMDLDLLRIECLENLDCITRDRMLGKKYKFLISAAPLTCSINNLFSIPFFGQFYKSSDNSHIWSRLFYNHLSGYGTPSLLLTKGLISKFIFWLYESNLTKSFFFKELYWTLCPDFFWAMENF